MQLPPIYGENYLSSRHDIFLDEIHRQAEGNPIIHLSMLAREGKKIPYGKYGNNAYVLSHHDLTMDILNKADQVLCGRNNTRNILNENMRHSLGYDEVLPMKGEKIICTRNNWDSEIMVGDIVIPMVNGLIGYVNSDPVSDYSRGYMSLDFKPEFATQDSEIFSDIKINLSPFEPSYDNYNHDFHNDEGIKINNFDFGSSITIHKSQGSQWDNVVLYSEMMHPKDYNRLLYTGITRASKNLILAV